MKNTFKVAQHIAWRRVGDEIIALDLNSSVYFSLNETGARIFELIAGNAPLEDAVGTVAKEYSADPKLVSKDAAALLKDLRKEKILEAA